MKNIYNLLVKITGIRLTREYPRPSTKKAIEIFGKKPIKVIEIGTDKGYNAKNMLQSLNISKIYLIDPYKSYREYTLSQPNRTPLIQSKAKIKAKRNLRKWDNKNQKIKWIRKFSDNAIKDIKEKIDFIYIDGNHTYKYVLNDLKNYYPLVKEGGILSGHDINWKGVAKAVCEFCKEKNIYFVADKKDWYIIKK